MFATNYLCYFLVSYWFIDWAAFVYIIIIWNGISTSIRVRHQLECNHCRGLSITQHQSHHTTLQVWPRAFTYLCKILPFYRKKSTAAATRANMI